MSVDYGRLVQHDRVHSRIFTDQAMFEDELTRIFEGGWVYVAHESEVPQRGDYVTRFIGRQPVIVSRTEDGVKLHLNRCRHRGTAVCNREQGNAKFFRCPYHGWTYGDDGRLVGVPYPSAYDDDFDKADFGLTPVPVVASYQGLIFASLVPTGTSLVEWLGPRVCDVIDAFVDASPVGRLVVRSGCNKTSFRGNWKYVGMDGYHFNFTHKSMNALLEHHGRPPVKEYEEKAPGRMWDFGNGHCRLDHDALRGREHVENLITRIRLVPGGPEYLGALEARLGPRFGDALSRSYDPHLGVWPNFQLIASHIRIVRPIAADRTEVLLFPTQLEGAPEAVNEERLRRHQLMFGPAGFVQPDDSELFERNHIGLQATVDPWILLARGLGGETVHDDGAISGPITGETTQRAQMRMWLRQMTGVADGIEADGVEAVAR